MQFSKQDVMSQARRHGELRERGKRKRKTHTHTHTHTHREGERERESGSKVQDIRMTGARSVVNTGKRRGGPGRCWLLAGLGSVEKGRHLETSCLLLLAHAASQVAGKARHKTPYLVPYSVLLISPQCRVHEGVPDTLSQDGSAPGSRLMTNNEYE